MIKCTISSRGKIFFFATERCGMYQPVSEEDDDDTGKTTIPVPSVRKPPTGMLYQPVSEEEDESGTGKSETASEASIEDKVPEIPPIETTVDDKPVLSNSTKTGGYIQPSPEENNPAPLRSATKSTKSGGSEKSPIGAQRKNRGSKALKHPKPSGFDLGETQKIHQAADDWNGRFQEILEKPESLEKNKELSILYKDFVYASKVNKKYGLDNFFNFLKKTYGRIIISEKYLHEENRQIKSKSIGGRAGGVKYKVLFFEIFLFNF